jgi:hypothetical protein
MINETGKRPDYTSFDAASCAVVAAVQNRGEQEQVGSKSDKIFHHSSKSQLHIFTSFIQQQVH